MSRTRKRLALIGMASLLLMLPACARSFIRSVDDGDLAGGTTGSVGSGGASGGYYSGTGAYGGWDGYSGYGGGYPVAGGTGYGGYSGGYAVAGGAAYGAYGGGYPTAGATGYGGYSGGYAVAGGAAYGAYGGGYPVAGGAAYGGYGGGYPVAGGTGYGGYGGTYGWCGDGIVNGFEQCDGGNLAGQSCWSLGFPGGGYLYCYWGSCTFDVSGCYRGICGDGIVDPYEECDGFNLGGMSCESFGFDGGPLYCDPYSCIYDTSWCVSCGDGRIDEGEQCEGPDLNGQSCISLGYIGGELRCDPYDCSYDVSRCAVCGDGVVQVGENCDGSDLRGRTCSSLGLGGGVLQCDPAVCLYDTSGCDASDGPRCGNGVAERGEQCDGTDLLNATCVQLGYDGGQLQCNPSTCRYNTSGCILPPPDASCSRCVEQNCGEALAACRNDPLCVEGMDCVPRSCGLNADVMCALNCYGGSLTTAQRAVAVFTCVISLCDASCIGGL